MVKQRKKPNVKLSRKKKKLVEKEREGIAADGTSKIPESRTSQHSLNENSKLCQADVQPSGDIKEDLIEDIPDLVHGFTDKEEIDSELDTVGKIWRWRNLPPYLFAGG